MLDMKKVLAGAAVAAGSLVSTQALAETTGSLNITSEYMFRGIVSSAGAAVQGSFDWAAPTGLYAGSWVSNTTGDEGNFISGTELDVYGGWAGDMGNGLGVDLGFVYYAFTDQDEAGSSDLNYWEIYGGLSYGGLSGSIYYADDFFGTDGMALPNGSAGDGSMVYVTLAYTANIKEGLDMTFQVGNSSGDGVDVLFGDSYTDWSITTTKDLGDGWAASGAYVQTDLDDVNGGVAGSQGDDPKFVVSLSKEFAL